MIDLGSSAPFKLDNMQVRSYENRLIRLIPGNYLSKYFQGSEKWMQMSIREKLDNLEAVLHDIKGISFQMDKLDQMPDRLVNSSEGENGTEDEMEDLVTMENEEYDEENEHVQCAICTHLKNAYEFDVFGHHAYKKSKTGIIYSKPDSCPSISRDRISDKVQYLHSFTLCRKCLEPCNDAHYPENCNFLDRAPGYQCSHRDCTERLTTCTSHIAENSRRLEKLKTSLKAQNCIFNY